jgi:hypothetical protein
MLRNVGGFMGDDWSFFGQFEKENFESLKRKILTV